MKIRWHGHACFEVGDDETTFVFDPHDGEYIGIEPPKVYGDVILVSHDHNDHNKVNVVRKPDSDIVRGDGKKKVRGYDITGLLTYHDEVKGKKRGENVIFTLDINGVKICHLGDLGCMPDDDTIKKMRDCDIIMIPVGGTFTLDGRGAWNVVKTLKPKVVIPMHYRVAGLSLGISSLDVFIEQCEDIPTTKVGNEVLFEKDDLPDELTVWVFSR